MREEMIILWGREFQLGVHVRCHNGDAVLDTQQQALNDLLNDSSVIADAEEHVKEYLIRNNPDEFPTDTVDNVFKYLIPKRIFIPRNNKHAVAAILCNYRFDEEHGLAIVFEDGKFKEIGPQDIVL